MTIQHQCPFCGEYYNVTVDRAAWNKYMRGATVQSVFPELPPVERDIVAGRFCTTCGYNLYNLPRPGEDWGNSIGHCNNCDCRMYTKDVIGNAAICPSCHFPNEIDDEGKIIEVIFDFESLS